ncbi:hypothetical protein [Natronomonas gomsonensis]|uniref:hypothetical protein n=1 Tax=Natronomonas gomsonensis TaxID=1046043 RepID=UPI0020CA3EEC|nr:hypothetical protein [Natronomonas gomsonensis]
MDPVYTFVGGGDPATTVHVARLLAYGSIGVAAAILLGYLVTYVRDVLAEGFDYEWGYLAVGIGAAVVYGVSGIAAELTDLPWLDAFTEGAVLFFILFVALGIRAMYLAERTADGASRLLPTWVDFLVVGVFVVAWWAGFLLDGEWTRPVVAVGWVGASVWAMLYAVQTVRRYEGTTLSALTRHLLPSIVCVVAIVMTDLLSSVAPLDAGTVDALWLVGTVLVAAFLFDTAVTIRQQEGEVERMYDRTTWRQQSVE